jgi:hypothetical protein
VIIKRPVASNARASESMYVPFLEPTMRVKNGRTNVTAVAGLLSAAASLMLTAGAMAQVPIALNYNFNGMVHAGEAGQPDSLTGFRAISDRGLLIDGAAGSLGTTPIVGGTSLPYTIVTTPGVLDVVHLGDRAFQWPYEAAIPGTNADVGVRPTWDADSNHTGPQTTTIAGGIAMFPNSELGFLYQISNGGGQFDVVLGFSDGGTVTVRLAGPDWFGGTATVPARLAGVTRQARLGGTNTVWPSTNFNDSGLTAPAAQRLSVMEGVMTAAQIETAGLGTIAGRTLTSISFGNATYPAGATLFQRGYAIMAATHRGSAVFPPLATGAATPASIISGDSTLLTVTPTLGSGTPNNITGISVNAAGIGLGTLALNDGGLNGDLLAGDGIWSSTASPVTGAPGAIILPFTATDAQNRTATGNITVNIVVPPTATELGTLADGLTSSAGDVAAAGVNWLTFTLAAPVDRAAGQYLDIDTQGSLLSNEDSEIGLYDSGGNLIATDDDGGPDFFSQLTFGVDSPARPAIGNGLAYNGRNGAVLPAGRYYLAYAAFNTTFNATLWNVTSASTATGPVTVNIAKGNVPAGGLPASFTEMGTLSGPAGGAVGSTTITATANIDAAGGVKWFQFNLDSPIDRANREYVDIDTEGSVIGDTVMALFRDDGTGTLVGTDNDSGSALLSQLSYGRGTRDAFLDSNLYDGRNGATLAAGTYYVAVAEAPASFGTNFIVWLNGGLNTGDVTLSVRRGIMSNIVAGPIVNPSNGNSYYLLENGPNWIDAEAAAVALGGHLASMDDFDENFWVVNNVLRFDGNDRRAWIGYTDQDSEGTFVWSNGSTATYTNWNAGEPNNANGTEHYTEILGNGTWNDLPLVGAATGNFAIVEVPGASTACLADVAVDGTVDGTDFIAFINSFAIGDASVDSIADVAGGGNPSLPEGGPDGTIDGTDFIAFINAFAAGC